MKNLLEQKLGAEITIPAGEEKVLLVRSVGDCKISLQEGARLTFILFGDKGWGESAQAGTGQRAPKIEFDFVGSDSELLFLGFVIGTGVQTYNLETISRHLVPRTKAHYYLRAAMFDSSVVDYKGNLIIEKPAQITDTYLAHHTLLLGEKARARTVPALEIEADDVKAGHAATIGKVDKELMFYLLSRGIDQKQAEQMLISGFFETQLKMIGDEKLRESLREEIMEMLPKHAHTFL